mmetsp:Transcript_50193/g.129188  ORF Transcript_50193/g.129188 Transcript_50193/m.129188 type:complete len:177 (-) Transcript_50193:674-1204(-)
MGGRVDACVHTGSEISLHRSLPFYSTSRPSLFLPPSLSYPCLSAASLPPDTLPSLLFLSAWPTCKCSEWVEGWMCVYTQVARLVFIAPFLSTRLPALRFSSPLPFLTLAFQQLRYRPIPSPLRQLLGGLALTRAKQSFRASLEEYVHHFFVPLLRCPVEGRHAFLALKRGVGATLE